MKDKQILKQLLNGYHLELKELKRAERLLKNLSIEVKNRLETI